MDLPYSKSKIEDILCGRIRVQIIRVLLSGPQTRQTLCKILDPVAYPQQIDHHLFALIMTKTIKHYRREGDDWFQLFLSQKKQESLRHLFTLWTTSHNAMQLEEKESVHSGHV